MLSAAHAAHAARPGAGPLACHSQARCHTPQAGTNFLGHAGLYASMERFLRGRPQPLRLLELGCGDARHTAAMLHRATAAGCCGGLQVAEVTAVDVSPSALALAARNFAGLRCGSEPLQAELVQQDMKVRPGLPSNSPPSFRR